MASPGWERRGTAGKAGRGWVRLGVAWQGSGRYGRRFITTAAFPTGSPPWCIIGVTPMEEDADGPRERNPPL